MQHQGLASQHAHHPAREGDVAAQAHQHVGFDTAHHRQRLPEGAQQLEWQQRQGLDAFAAHTPKRDGVEGEAARRHQAAFHAVGRTQPVHLPALVAQRLGHRQAREDMSPGAAGHDECGLVVHKAPLRIMARFS